MSQKRGQRFASPLLAQVQQAQVQQAQVQQAQVALPPADWRGRAASAARLQGQIANRRRLSSCGGKVALLTGFLVTCKQN
jgi:hypothetical protein